MARLNILEFPDPRLRKIASPITDVTGKIATLADDMLETMYAAPGIGLAASQVNVHQRLIVVDVSDEKNAPVVLINPQIVSTDGERAAEEGCLSIPGFYEQVTRPATIEVAAINRAGDPFTLVAEDMLAVCIQHEMDHLEGRLFVDYISNAKRQMIRKKLIKQQRQQA
ncbi:MAG: peptide deformylase [Gammaproteobacteria bacterium]|uniref:Peptide deformylase n=1 Tax=OM182 bacterium MED-G24 TaxID=1986255 RepID=A0A2A5WX30_9GAMM|nr:peptide deformylase [Gammaproteobacteria bacterium]PDH41130.1 MAG: peptide deformylase [OM182 bacterium MED-G24]RPG27302.1 MAG: peptide deformylase [Gammaproteobacteria bacterium TMED50]|tara:strand:+ start:187 stop:690 length:504 start_codon:yes stop_codon:yes gene_type:complete